MSNLTLTSSGFPSLLADTFTQLHQVVFGGEDIWFLEENDLTTTRTSKIQHLIKKLQKLYAHPEAANYPPLSHLASYDDTSTPLQVFITAILAKEEEEEHRLLSTYVLRCLEKVDPSFAPINHQITRLFAKNKPSVNKDAYKNLLRLATQPFEPLKVSYPVKPHQLTKHPLVYVMEPGYSLSFGVHHMGQNHALHDKFWTITHIAIGALSESSIAFHQNLKEVGKQEGFVLRTWREKDFLFPWIRDVALFTPSGKMLLPSRLCCSPETVNMVRKLVDDENANTMGMVAEKNCTQKLSFLKEELYGVKEVPFYFEGGNLIPAINRKGELCYLSGQDNILFSLLNGAITFRGQEKRLLQKMHSLQGTDVYSVENVEVVRMRLAKTGLIDSFSKSEQEGIAKIAIAGFMCIREMMEETIGHPVLLLDHPLVSQVDFHLDMLFAPAPEGLIFMNDPDVCYELLKRILRTCKLSEEEKDRLLLYVHHARIQRQEIGGKLERMELSLTKAGFKVCRVPAVFYDDVNQIAVHFLNGIFGKGKEGNFCITNGSPHPLDKYLRDAFTGYMKSYGIDRVYFTGRPSSGEVSSHGGLPYFPARDSLRNFGGIHCRTQEFNLLYKDKEEDDLSEIELPVDPMKIEESLPQFFKHMLGLLKQKT